MDKKITEALSKLDATNDNHWTQEGLPRLDTMRILTGNPGLNRDDISAASPEFVRPAAAPQAPASTPSEQGGTEPAAAAPAAPQVTQSTDLVGAPLAETDTGLEALTLELEEVTLTFNDACVEAQDAKVRVNALQNEMDALATRIAQLRVEQGDNPIRGYLDGQVRELEERARRQKELQDSGIDFGALTAGMRAPIDSAFASRKKR